MVNTLSEPLGVAGQPVSEEAVVNSVIPLKQLLEDCSSSSTVIKKMLHECLEASVKRVLELLPYLLRCQSTCEAMLSFIHASFLVLQQQFGPELIQEAVQIMLNLFTRYFFVFISQHFESM